LKIKYNPPSSVGIDRIIAASAAIQKYGKPFIVCDFGTATTIDTVNSQGEYLGGTITPGMNVLAEALFEKTSKLPKAEIKKPENIIGNSTVNSIQAGIYFGYAGLVEGIINRMIMELGEKPKVIATGGLARFIAESCELIETVDDTLMLEGLRLTYERNCVIKKTKN
jgi:type III pantothenate kinase